MLNIRTFKGLTEMSGNGDHAELCADSQEIIYAILSEIYKKVKKLDSDELAKKAVNTILIESMKELAKEGVIDAPENMEDFN